MVDDADARAQRFHLFHVVAGVDDGDAGAVEAADLVEDVVARLRIDAGRRLVQQDQPRLVDQRGAEVEPAFHAAGEGARAVVGAVGQADGLKRLSDALVQLRGFDAVQLAKEAQVLTGRQLTVKREFLGYNADLAAQITRGGAQRPT